MVAKYCTKCGAKVSEHSKVCSACGNETLAGISHSRLKGRAGIGRYAAIVGGVLVIAGACLPWVDIHNTVENTSELGIERGMQGIYALVLGIIIVVCVFIEFNKLGSRAVITAIFAMQAFALGIFEALFIGGYLGDVWSAYGGGEGVRVREGIYLLTIGGFMGLAGIFPNPARKFPEATGDVYPCPQCMQLIKSEWEVCPYCGVILANVAE